MNIRETAPDPGVRWWDQQGLRGGLIAGVGFAAIELLLMDVQEGQLAVARFLRRIAAMWIGPAALDPGYSFGIAVVVGIFMHAGLSALFGLTFTALTESSLPRLLRYPRAILAAALLYGMLLWPINAYLVAPFVGWEWFARETEPVVLAASHLCYGLVLGLYLERRAARLRVWIRQPGSRLWTGGAHHRAR